MLKPRSFGSNRVERFAAPSVPRRILQHNQTVNQNHSSLSIAHWGNSPYFFFHWLRADRANPSAKCRRMIARALPLPSSLSSPRPISFDSSRRRSIFPEAAANAPTEEPGAPAGRKRANLVALRKERVKLPYYTDVHGRAFSISEFLHHPSGVEALLNTRALQSFESLSPNTYRCTLHKIQFLAFEVAPVLELRVLPTNDDCTVEMLACKFEGSESLKKQNNLFAAFMRNHITWEVDCSDPCLEVDVILRVSLEVYTKPFSLLPISAVEKPGNLVMQGLIDRLIPLLAEQLLKDYTTWVEQQLQLFP